MVIVSIGEYNFYVLKFSWASFFTAYEFDIMPKNQLVTVENTLKMVVLQ